MNGTDWLWTASQRRALLGVVIVLGAILAVIAWRNPLYVSDPPPPAGPRAGEVLSGIDPNQADVNTLASLPQLGLKRAAAICAYREKYVAAHPGRRAFVEARDLTKVPGISAATAEELGPYLIFGGRQGAVNPQ